MTAADVTVSRREVTPNLGVKEVILISGTTITGATDYLTLDLSAYGITNVLTVDEYVHTTDYSVIVAGAAPSTSVTDGELKIITTTGNNNKRRVIVVKGI